MTLLRQIQISAVSSDRPISDLLRLCKILASRLKSDEFGEWVNHELNGYPEGIDLPAYRTLNVQSLGDFAGPFGGRLQNAPIPMATIPESLRDYVRVAYVRQPISGLEDLLRKDSEGSFQIPWPADFTAVVGKRIYTNMNCISAWQVIPRGDVVGLLDVVRNKVLNFALEIESMAPSAGEALPNERPVPQESVRQTFNNFISGNVGNIASGNQSVSQQANMAVRQGAFDDLAARLAELGFEPTDVDELQQAIEVDSSAGKKQIGSSVGAWIGKAIGKAGSGAIKLSVSTASEILPKLISQYLGLSE